MCVICNSQNFDVMDGLYFCTQCGTQSQVSRSVAKESLCCDKAVLPLKCHYGFTKESAGEHKIPNRDIITDRSITNKSMIIIEIMQQFLPLLTLLPGL